MKTGVELRGFQELDRKMERAAKALPESKQREILADAGEIVADEMRVLVPVDEGDLRGSIRVSVDEVRRGAFGLGRFTSRDQFEVLIGPSRGGSPDGFHAHFVELGTVNMPAQPFIRPAFDNTQGQVRQRIASGVTSAISKELG